MTDDSAKLRRARVLALPLERVGTRPGFLAGTVSSWKAVWERRDLVSQLTRREIRAKYKNSSLGIAWSLFKPLAQLLIYYFAIGKVLGVERSIPSFAVFVFVGLTGWTLFTEIVSRSTSSIVANAGLIKKVYLPREVFPLAAVGGAIFNFLIQLTVLFVAMLVFREVPISWDIGYAILGIALLVFLGAAIGMLLAAANVILRDTEHLVEVALVVMFWASPIVYSFSYVTGLLKGNWLEKIYVSNPVTLAIMGMQRGLWVAGGDADAGAVWPAHLGVLLALALVASVLVLWLAQRVFARAQGNFAQEL